MGDSILLLTGDPTTGTSWTVPSSATPSMPPIMTDAARRNTTNAAPRIVQTEEFDSLSNQREDYLYKLNADLLEQFKHKPNTFVFNKAIAKQLEELYEFFAQLNFLRWLKNYEDLSAQAEGVQLDGIGNIVDLSRLGAMLLAHQLDLTIPLDDKDYRHYLMFKVHWNTSDSTHSAVYKALRMFWHTPLYYAEDISHPATIFFTTPELTPEDNASQLLLAPKIKAAGVTLKILATTVTPGEPGIIRIGGVAWNCINELRLAQYQPLKEYEATVRIGGVAWNCISELRLPPYQTAIGGH